MRKSILISIIFMTSLFSGELGDPAKPRPKQFEMVTMARAGNVLLYEILFNIAKVNKEDYFFGRIDPKLKCSTDPKWYVQKHFYDRFFRIDSRRPTLALIRDPRDLAVATVRWHDKMIKEGHWLWVNQAAEETEQWKKLDFNHKLAAVIKNRFNVPPYNHFKDDCDKAAMWMQKKDLFLVRFEDLVGPKFGGTHAQRAESVARIAEFAMLPLPGLSTNYVLSEYEKVLQPQDGKVGQWRKYFIKGHKKAFKKYYGDHLILLGYERNHNW